MRIMEVVDQPVAREYRLFECDGIKLQGTVEGKLYCVSANPRVFRSNVTRAELLAELAVELRRLASVADELAAQ